VELDELHVDQLGAGMIGERMAVAGAFPAVAGDPISAADAAGREHDRLGAEGLETPPLAVVANRAGHPAAVEQQRHHGEFHVDVESAMDAVILQRADHLEAGAVADVREPRILVAAEVALEDAAVGGAIEQRPPGFELADPVGRLPGVELGHPPVVDVLAAAHRVGEVHPPAVTIVDVGERRRHAPFRHDGVGLAEQRLADQPDFDPRRRGLDGGTKTGAAGADDEHIVLVGCVGQRILQSVRMPIEQSLT
jgi:hypothetical protein